jgi:hypothetical protein
MILSPAKRFAVRDRAPAAAPGRREARPYPLLGQGAFELGQGAEDTPVLAPQ